MTAPSYHCEINLGVSLNVIFDYADKTIVKGYFFKLNHNNNYWDPYILIKV